MRRTEDSSLEELQEIAEHSYDLALKGCTKGELIDICESVGIYTTGSKQTYLDELETYRETHKHTKGGYHV